MPEVTETVRVHAPPGTLWREDGGFSGVGAWHPMLDEVETDGEAVGATRIAHGKDGSVQIERLHAVDQERRRYRYAMEKTAMPVRDYTAEFRVEDAGEGASLVTWSARFDLAEGGDDRTVEGIRHFLHAGLDSLRAKYDAGSPRSA